MFYHILSVQWNLVKRRVWKGRIIPTVQSSTPPLSSCFDLLTFWTSHFFREVSLSPCALVRCSLTYFTSSAVASSLFILASFGVWYSYACRILVTGFWRATDYLESMVAVLWLFEVHLAVLWGIPRSSHHPLTNLMSGGSFSSWTLRCSIDFRACIRMGTILIFFKYPSWSLDRCFYCIGELMSLHLTHRLVIFFFIRIFFSRDWPFFLQPDQAFRVRRVAAPQEVCASNLWRLQRGAFYLQALFQRTLIPTISTSAQSCKESLGLLRPHPWASESSLLVALKPAFESGWAASWFRPWWRKKLVSQGGRGMRTMGKPPQMGSLC